MFRRTEFPISILSPIYAPVLTIHIPQQLITEKLCDIETCDQIYDPAKCAVQSFILF